MDQFLSQHLAGTVLVMVVAVAGGGASLLSGSSV